MFSSSRNGNPLADARGSEHPVDLQLKKGLSLVSTGTYLNWLTEKTATSWWHDSADPAELQLGLERGATGATTNPYLSSIALSKNGAALASVLDSAHLRDINPEQKAEELMRCLVTPAAAMYEPIYHRSGGRYGYVCAQVNPSRAGEREAMLKMARRFHAWAPNIAVKLPAVSAGLDVLEECIAEGITATATVSFTVPQVIAVAERCRAGTQRAQSKGVEPGRCFAVIMIGRLDDYLREVALDNNAGVTETDIRQSGLAVTKRARAIYREKRYEAVLMISALRGTYHLTELAGGELCMSIAPAAQEWFVTQDLAREERIEKEIPREAIERLYRLPEFVKAYEPEGMASKDFIGYGAVQRTLCEYIESGWKLMERF